MYTIVEVHNNQRYKSKNEVSGRILKTLTSGSKLKLIPQSDNVDKVSKISSLQDKLINEGKVNNFECLNKSSWLHDTVIVFFWRRIIFETDIKYMACPTVQLVKSYVGKIPDWLLSFLEDSKSNFLCVMLVDNYHWIVLHSLKKITSDTMIPNKIIVKKMSENF